MRTLVKIFVTALVIAGVSYILPYWSIAIVTFLVALALPTGNWSSFLNGFTAAFLAWSVFALILMNGPAEVINRQIAQLFSLPPVVMALIAGLIAGLIGGFGGWSGYTLSKIFEKKKSNNPYH